MSELPRRIQRRRSKGWRMPEGAVYVGRPGRWGNPYVVLSSEILVHDDGRDWWCPTEHGGARAAAVEMYRDDLLNDRLAVVRIATVGAAQRELAGRNLACWCPLDQPCHADVLLQLANPEAAR